MIRGGRTRSALVLLAALLSFPFTDKLSAQQEVSCVVERITDGDTIACDGERVRLLLIDAPEEGQGPFGPAAAAFLQAILPVGSQATLAMDVEHRDPYGRLLAYVYRPEGRMVNAMMVRQGFAVPLVVPPNVRHVEMIRAAADSARANRIGLWAVDAFECSPQEFRDSHCGRTAAAVTPALHGVAPDPSETASRGGCDPSYPDVCIPPPRPDLDCRDIVHRRFRVIGADPHQFDGNHDGVGCEGPQ